MQTPIQTERQALDAAINAVIASATRPATGAIILAPIKCATKPRWLESGRSCYYGSGRQETHIQRMFDSEHGTTWFGRETRSDQLGRLWDRSFHAVVGDFGDLVEVPIC